MTIVQIVPTRQNRSFINAFSNNIRPADNTASSSAAVRNAFTANYPKSTKDRNVGTITLRSTTPVRWFLPPHNWYVPSFEFVIAPNDISFSGISDNMEELSRPGREPLLYRSSSNLYKIDFTTLIGDPNRLGTASCETSINWLRILARTPVQYTLTGTGDATRANQWKIVDLTIRTLRMNPRQEIVLAEASISLSTIAGDQNNQYRIPGMIAIKDVPVARGGSGGSRTETVGFSAGGSGDVWSGITR